MDAFEILISLFRTRCFHPEKDKRIYDLSQTLVSSSGDALTKRFPSEEDTENVQQQIYVQSLHECRRCADPGNLQRNQEILEGLKSIGSSGSHRSSRCSLSRSTRTKDLWDLERLPESLYSKQKEYLFLFNLRRLSHNKNNSLCRTSMNLSACDTL